MQWLVDINNGIDESGITALVTGLLVFCGAIFYHTIKIKPEKTGYWHHVIAALIPLLTGTAYLSIVLGTGTLELSNGRIYHIARWLDACLVSPLILFNIVLLLGPSIRKLAHLITLLLITNLLTMVGGLFAGLQVDPFVSWIWYGYGSLAYLGSIWLLLKSIPAAAERLSISQKRLTAYRRYALFYVGISLAFPVIWFFTPAALGQLSLNGEVIAFLPFDLATKVGLMFFVARDGGRLSA